MFLKFVTKLFFVITVLVPSSVLAAVQESGDSKYLEYKEPAVTTASSSSSTFLYILSLLFVFCIVLFLAYFVSRFIGTRFGNMGTFKSKNILGVLPLEQNKRILFLDVVDTVLVLGVTEQNISLLKEISSADEVKKLKEELQNSSSSSALLGYESQTLDELKSKLKPLLKNLPGSKKGDIQ